MAAQPDQNGSTTPAAAQQRQQAPDRRLAFQAHLAEINSQYTRQQIAPWTLGAWQREKGKDVHVHERLWAQHRSYAEQGDQSQGNGSKMDLTSG